MTLEFFLGFSGHALSVEVQTNHRQHIAKVPETGVLELVKHWYCFNSKGDNFIVEKL